MSPVETLRIPIHDGELHVERAGTGPALVLAHGGYLDASMWDEQMAAFTAAHTVIRYDARSQGRSRSAVGDHHPDDDLAELLTALGIERAALVGTSMGGGTACSFALMHPERVSALVLAGPGIPPVELRDPFVLDLYREQAAAIESQDPERYVEAFLRYCVDGAHRSPEEADPVVRKRCHDMALTTITAHHAAVGAMLERDAMGQLERISAPTLLIAGDLELSDLLRMMDEAERRMPDARTVTISGAGHMVMMERPAEFNATVLDFLESVPA